MEYRYNRAERRIRHHIHRNKESLDALLPNYKITLVTDDYQENRYPIYSDTTLFDTTTAELQHMGEKTVILEVDSLYYKAIIKSPMDDLVKLKDDIFGALIPAFILLALAIVIFNYLLSGYFFRPFNKILGSMKTYDVGQKTPIDQIETSTIEFRKMQELFLQMIERIEFDYQNLKEYTEHMAHEIQTPLAVILNKTESLIADEEVMKKQKDTVKTIYDEVTHLSKLGSGLNLLTKINNREFTKAEKIVTKPFIEKHVTSVTEMAQLKSLVIETSLNEDHTFFIDPFLLDIILKNLLRNAISYGKSDGPIQIKTDKKALIISNYGQAADIAEEKIFERFYRNHKNKSSLGLGLSLVKKICELNQLNINYVYENGQHIFKIENS